MTPRWFALVIASLGMAGCVMASSGGLCPGLPPAQTKIRFRGYRFELQYPDDLRRLEAVVKADVDSRHDAKTMTSLIEAAVAPKTSTNARCGALVELAEIADSLDLATRNPTPRRIDLFYGPFLYYDLMHNPVGKGTTPASNLAGSAAVDLSLRDPLPSTFWSRPSDIPSEDLFEEFGPIVRVDDEVCDYDEPKTSYGTTPGFTMKCRAGALKVKFGELDNQKRDTEVAISRLFGALGYHVEPSDYAPRILLRYDRRLFLEFNSRKDLDITFTFLGFIPVGHKVVQKPQDPFHYVRSAVMKDGTVVSPEDLARALIRPEILSRRPKAAKKQPRGTSADHYRADAASFEAGIDHLVMDEANVQPTKSGGQNIGPWSWDRLGHDGLRELRGAALVFAWTNCFDVRWGNNRLKRDGAGIRHTISDLGNGLGRADNFRVDEQGLVNDFPWSFTEPQPFRIVSYQPVFGNRAFEDMTVDDARWSARLIAQLTEPQIQQALIAAGFTSAEVKVYTEKLISRRDRMIQDLGLASEIPPLRPQGPDRAIDYDPKKDGPVEVRSPNGAAVHPIESRDLIVRAGRVEPR